MRLAGGFPSENFRRLFVEPFHHPVRLGIHQKMSQGVPVVGCYPFVGIHVVEPFFNDPVVVPQFCHHRRIVEGMGSGNQRVLVVEGADDFPHQHHLPRNGEIFSGIGKGRQRISGDTGVQGIVDDPIDGHFAGYGDILDGSRLQRLEGLIPVHPQRLQPGMVGKTVDGVVLHASRMTKNFRKATLPSTKTGFF